MCIPRKKLRGNHLKLTLAVLINHSIFGTLGKLLLIAVSRNKYEMFWRDMKVVLFTFRFKSLPIILKRLKSLTQTAIINFSILSQSLVALRGTSFSLTFSSVTLVVNLNDGELARCKHLQFHLYISQVAIRFFYLNSVYGS